MERDYLEECLLLRMTLREIAAEQGCAHSKVWYWVKKHGLEYVPRRKYSAAQMRGFAEGCTSVSGVMRKMGVHISGSSHELISRRLTEVGIVFGPEPSRRHSRVRLTADQILVRRPSGSGRIRPPALRRALIEIGVPEKCLFCGQPPEWCGKPLRLQVDHADGDAANNERTNLRFLCPNCHSQTETYGNKATSGLFGMPV